MVETVRRTSIARQDPLESTTRLVLDIAPGVLAIVTPPQPDTVKIELEENKGFLLWHNIEVSDVTGEFA